MGDPVAAGLLQNMARPEGNITGIAGDAGIEMQGKHLALLHEAVPSASRVSWKFAWRFLTKRLSATVALAEPRQSGPAAADRNARRPRPRRPCDSPRSRSYRCRSIRRCRCCPRCRRSTCQPSTCRASRPSPICRSSGSAFDRMRTRRRGTRAVAPRFPRTVASRDYLVGIGRTLHIVDGSAWCNSRRRRRIDIRDVRRRLRGRLRSTQPAPPPSDRLVHADRTLAPPGLEVKALVLSQAPESANISLR
ncbi:hypothetical protein ACVW16_000332 [Bradyrhizobium sp. USDA 4474]